MKNKKLQALIEERAKLIKDAQAFVNDAASFGAEEEERHVKMMAKASELQKQIDAIRLMDAEADRLNDLVAFNAGKNDISVDEQHHIKAKYDRVFNKFMREGFQELDDEERGIIRAGFQKGPQASLSLGSGAAGGYTVPTGFITDMDVALKPFVGVIEAGAEVITTNSGEALPWPTANDTGNAGRIITEGATTNVVDPAFGQVTFGASIYTSDIIKLGLGLVQDSAVDLMGFVKNIAAERVGRIQNQHFTTGTGTGQPKGFLTAATQAKVTAAAGTFTFDELSDLKYSVNKSYRDAPKAAFMVADSALNIITKMKDGENRPLLLPSTRDGEPDRILNKPLYSNTDMPDVATGVKSVAFGDFSKYKVRNVSGDFLARIEQPYIANYEVAFIYFRRTDANLVDAGTAPIKFLKQA